VEKEKAKYRIKYDYHESSVEEDYDYSGRHWSFDLVTFFQKNNYGFS